MEKFMFVSSVLQLSNPSHQLLVAEQEKALKEEFELSRRRLMAASQNVQELKTRVHFAGKEASNV